MALTWDELEQINGRKEWRIPIPPTCDRCGYILSGLPSSRCPECGTDFHWPTVRRRAGRIWSAVNTLRHAQRDAIVGLKIAGIGWGVWLILALPTLLGRGSLPWAACFLRLLIACGAVLSIVLSSQVLNVRRVPVWARRYVEGPAPNIWIGMAGILLSVMLLVAIFVI